MAKQIDDQLLFDLIKYHVLAYEDDGLTYDAFHNPTFEKSLTDRLSAKWTAWQKQMAFKEYKTAETKKERESARNEYLDLQGVPKQFRR